MATDPCHRKKGCLLQSRLSELRKVSQFSDGTRIFLAQCVVQANLAQPSGCLLFAKSHSSYSCSEKCEH